MTRYDPHPQAHDDARTTRSGSTSAPSAAQNAVSDSVGAGEAERRSGLLTTLDETLAVSDAAAGLREALEALRKRPCENYEAPQDCITAGPQVLAAEGCGPCVARASQAPREALEALAVRFDASADNLQRAIRNQRPEPARRLSREWSQRAEAWRLAAHALRAALAAHPADAPEAPEPSGDVLEQAARVIDLAMREAVPEEKSPIPGPDSVDRFVAQSLADAGLLVDPEVSERAERLPRLYRDLDGMRLLRDEAVGKSDRARHLAADMEARVAELEADVERARHSRDWAWRCANGYDERAEAAEARTSARVAELQARAREAEAQVVRLTEALRRVTRALDDEEANLADDDARLSHAVVRRLRAALSDGATR